MKYIEKKHHKFTLNWTRYAYICRILSRSVAHTHAMNEYRANTRFEYKSMRPIKQRRHATNCCWFWKWFGKKRKRKKNKKNTHTKEFGLIWPTLALQNSSFPFFRSFAHSCRFYYKFSLLNLFLSFNIPSIHIMEVLSHNNVIIYFRNWNKNKNERFQTISIYTAISVTHTHTHT